MRALKNVLKYFKHPKHLRHYTNLCVWVCGVALSLSACQTLDASLYEDSHSAELLRFAQEAYAQDNYERAFFFYNLILDRPSTDRTTELIVNYEIAFLYYKQRNYEASKDIFEYLLAEYQRNTDGYPLWVYRLTQKVYDKLPSVPNS